MEILLLGAALLLAFANGANDNFKGFATVWGADLLTYRQALALATGASLAGSLASLVLAQELVRRFSGKGLVPDAVAAAPDFVFAVALGAGLTVLVATRAGLPVSTTHALVGALVGAGAAAGGALNLTALMQGFLIPLLVSPLLAALLGWAAYRGVRRRHRVPDCACVTSAVTAEAGSALALLRPALSVMVDHAVNCPSGPGTVRVTVGGVAEGVHVLSAATICFARGVNDTPKLTALLVAGHLLGAGRSALAVGAVMAVGGVLFARRVAETMSRRVTRMDADQGLAANLVSAGLVLFASKLGVPVSTTHVSVGSIAGVGAGAIDWAVMRGVLLSWVATLPLAAACAWAAAVAV
ncbi:MAG: inorganic phosphate transporter [Nitrospirae bacterium]|nr:inorganic phosphate transporter [Nitrospirota bacterium]